MKVIISFSIFLFLSINLSFAKPLANLGALKTYTLKKEGQTYLNTEFDLTFQKYEIQDIGSTIILKGYGEVGFFIHTQGSFIINLNYDVLTNFLAQQTRLPNGGPIPFISEMGTIELEIENSPLKIYFAMNPSKIIVGLTGLIEQMDTVGEKVGNKTIFPKFKVEMFDVAVGGFLSAKKSENGLGAFIQYPFPGQAVVKRSNNKPMTIKAKKLTKLLK